MAPMAMTTSLLCPDAFLSPIEIDAAVMRALAEDLGRAGDVTSTATIPEDARARAVVSPVRTTVRISTAGSPIAASSSWMPASGTSRLRWMSFESALSGET